MNKIDKILLFSLLGAYCLLVFTYYYKPYSSMEEFLAAKSMIPFWVSIGSRLVAYILFAVALGRSISILRKRETSFLNKMVSYFAILSFLYFILGYIFALLINKEFFF